MENKVMEALDFIKSTLEKIEYYNHIKIDNSIYDSLDTIENALKANQDTNPSEAREYLGYIGGLVIPTTNGNQYLKDFYDKEFNIIRQALITKSKKEQAFEIIKEKNVNVYVLKISISVEHYNTTIKRMNFQPIFPYEIYYKLTEDEFNLLKGVLEDED